MLIRTIIAYITEHSYYVDCTRIYIYTAYRCTYGIVVSEEWIRIGSDEIKIDHNQLDGTSVHTVICTVCTYIQPYLCTA